LLRSTLPAFRLIFVWTVCPHTARHKKVIHKNVRLSWQNDARRVSRQEAVEISGLISFSTGKAGTFAHGAMSGFFMQR